MVAALVLFAMALLQPSLQEAPTNRAAFSDLLESMQPRLEDFRCLFEGKHYNLRPDEIAKEKLREDGLYETFSGTFIWKIGGDTFLDSYCRVEPSNIVTQETLIVTGETADHYLRDEDRPLGESYICDSFRTNPDRSHSLGTIFLVDAIRRDHQSTDLFSSIESSSLDGRRCTILTFRWNGSGDLERRYWIDLERGGHAFRREYYGEKSHLSLRTTIELSRFENVSGPIWMPISGITESFITFDASKKILYHDTPTDKEEIYIVAGTLEFNRHPSPSTFSAKHKPGTPVTDLQKQLEYEFGQQKSKPVSRSEAEAQLKAQLAVADAQKTELAASSPARSSDWSGTLTWAFGSIAMVGAIAILIARRR